MRTDFTNEPLRISELTRMLHGLLSPSLDANKRQTGTKYPGMKKGLELF
jgi:hypothetical protein